MLRITSSFALVCFLMAPLTAVAATVLQSVSSDARAVGPADQGPQRYAQNAVRAQPSAPKYPQVQGPPQVYLLRGLLNVFSLGMDDLAGKLQADGISATVMNHADSDYVASRIMTTYNSGGHGPVEKISHTCSGESVTLPNVPFDIIVPQGLALPQGDSVKVAFYNDNDFGFLRLTVDQNQRNVTGEFFSVYNPSNPGATLPVLSDSFTLHLDKRTIN